MSFEFATDVLVRVSLQSSSHAVGQLKCQKYYKHQTGNSIRQDEDEDENMNVNVDENNNGSRIALQF